MTNGNEKDGSKDGGAGGTTDEQRRYTASKGWVTRAVKTLTELLGKPESPDIVELHDSVDEFDKRLPILMLLGPMLNLPSMMNRIS